VDIRGKCGQYVTLKYGLAAMDVVVDITGKQSLAVTYGGLGWRRVYGGASDDEAILCFRRVMVDTP